MAGAGSTVCGGGLGEWGSCSWRRLGEGRAGRGETASGRAASGLPGCDTAADGVARGRDNRAKGGDGVLPSSALARATPPLQHMPRVVRAPRSTRPALPGVSASRTKFVTSSTDHRDRREKCEQERKTTTRRPRGGRLLMGRSRQCFHYQRPTGPREENRDNSRAHKCSGADFAPLVRRARLGRTGGRDSTPSGAA